MSVEIRRAEVSDAAAACEVLRRTIAECCVPDHRNDPAILGAWLGNKTPDTVATWFASATNFALVAVDDGAVVGVALLTGAGKLALCYLLPEAQRRGAGSAMLACIEEQACSWGVKALQLYATAQAVPFFAARGYVQAGVVRSPYGVDTTFCWKQLDGSICDGSPRRFCGCSGS